MLFFGGGCTAETLNGGATALIEYMQSEGCMMGESVWMHDIKLPHFEKLCGDIRTDVLVVGGGMCGLLCAYLLRRQGVDVTVAEAEQIGQGITKNTTAKITSQHGLIYDKLLRTVGQERAALYLHANERAVSSYICLCSTLGCRFERQAAYTYSLTSREKLEKEVRAVNQLGRRATLEEHLPLPFATKGAVCFPEQAQFHPLEFLGKLADGLPVYEHTFIRRIEGHTAVADGGRITAKKIIVATHFPFINAHGAYFLKLYQHRSYVVALSGAPQIDGMYVDEAESGLSFRRHGHLLLLGGGSHRTGKEGGGWQELRRLYKRYYPQAEEQYAWATQDCMSLDGIPYVGAYARHTPDLYVAAGFNKWGMTGSMAAAQLLCDLVLGKKNTLEELYSPQRSIWKPQLMINGAEAVAHLLLPKTRRCPHMGCALTWNKAEHSWDCACHGSRFERDGTLIDNPAMRDAEV